MIYSFILIISTKFSACNPIRDVLKRLTLKAPIKNCSRRHFNFLLLSFEENRLDFSYVPSAQQRIHLNHQVLSSLKTNEKIFMNTVSSTTVVIGALGSNTNTRSS